MRRIEYDYSVLSSRGRVRFHLSTRLRPHDREKDFDYPRYHTRPGRRSLFGTEFARLIGVYVVTAHMRARRDARLIPPLYPLHPRLCTKTWEPQGGSARHKRPKGRRTLGYYTMREDHRTGFHCCQILCHTVIDDLDREEARRHGTFGEETRFLAVCLSVSLSFALSILLLTKDRTTTPSENKVEGYPNWLGFFSFSLPAALLCSSQFSTSESRIAVGPTSLLVST